MSILGWNCRGLDRSRTVKALKDLVSFHRPTLIGLCETKLCARKWDSLRVVIGYRNCFSVNCTGRSGGLALLWNQDIDVTICSYSNSHIDVLVKGDTEFCFTIFYGNPRVDRKKKSWDLLCRLKRDRSES